MPLLQVRRGDWLPAHKNSAFFGALEHPWTHITRLYRDGPAFGGNPGVYAEGYIFGNHDLRRNQPYPLSRIPDPRSFWDHFEEMFPFDAFIQRSGLDPRALRRRPSIEDADWAAHTYAYMRRNPTGRAAGASTSPRPLTSSSS